MKVNESKHRLVCSFPVITWTFILNIQGQSFWHTFLSVLNGSKLKSAVLNLDPSLCGGNPVPLKETTSGVEKV